MADGFSTDRRAFFRRVLRKTGEKIADQADGYVSRRAAKWIRPPYALDELDFLLACTRCGECVSACPHQAIFLLSGKLGAQVMNTPALDLLNRGCHLCHDWPCVKQCKAYALLLPEADEDKRQVDNAERLPALPLLAKVSIDKNSCLAWQGPECGACRDSCSVPGALLWEGAKPHIDSQVCTGCAMCREACIVTPKAVSITSCFQQQEQDTPTSL